MYSQCEPFLQELYDSLTPLLSELITNLTHIEFVEFQKKKPKEKTINTQIFLLTFIQTNLPNVTRHFVETKLLTFPSIV